MSARLDIAEAYALTMRVEGLLEAARIKVSADAIYGDPTIRDLDDAWLKIRGAIDELRHMIARGEA